MTMLIEHIEIQRKRGVGDVVLLGLLILPSIVALVRLFARGDNKLRNTPEVRLFGKIPFGGAVSWGCVLFILGGLLLATFWSIETKDSADWWMFWLLVVPELLTGFWLMIFGAGYTGYRKAVDELLVKIARQGELTPVDLSGTLGGIKYKPEQTEAILKDLRENGIADFDDLGGGNYKVWLVDPALAALVTTREPNTPPGSAPKRTAWTCPACGAPNNTAADGVCEYCGGGRK